jgi:hypothetical protein
VKTCEILQGEVKTRGSLIEQTYVTVFWSHHYLSSCLKWCEGVCTIARGRETAQKSDWGNLSQRTLVPSLPQFLPILLWNRVFYCKGTWNRAEDWLCKHQSQYSRPIITSVSSYIVVWTCILLQGDVKPRGRLLDQISITVFFSHHFFSSCLYFYEVLCTIALASETARTVDWANLCHSIMVPSLTQFLPILLWKRQYYCKGTWNHADGW